MSASAPPSPVFVIGIDPGLQGAVAVLNDRGSVVSITDTPSFLIRDRRRDYNVPAMVPILSPYGDDVRAYAFIEQQQSRPYAAIQSTLKIGYGFGIWIGLLVSLHIPYTVVAPQRWQRKMYAGFTGEGKERSLMVVSRLWPDKRGLRHDQADALLIAEYGRLLIPVGEAQEEEVD